MKSIPLPSSIIQCVSTPRKCGVYRGELKNHQHTITIPARVMEDMPRASKGSRVEWEVIDPYTILLTLPGARAQENRDMGKERKREENEKARKELIDAGWASPPRGQAPFGPPRRARVK